jgi:hypothetical protein
MVLFGAAAGFGFWLHPMFVSSLLPLVAFVLWTLRRRLDAWISVVGGGILGCLPFLVWNALNGWPSLETPVRVPGTYADRMRTFATDLMPRALGLKDATLEWHHGVMGPLLYAAAIAVAAVGIWSLVRRPGPRSRWLPVVVLAGVFPIMALFRNLIYANDGRYGIIALPVIVVVLAVGVDHLAGKAPTWRAVAVIGVVAAVWFVGLVRPTAAPFLELRGTDPNAQLGEIVDVLDDAGIERIYGSYWATLPVDFAGDNRIVSGVFPFWPVRFPERQRVVESTPPDGVAVLFMRSDENPADLLLPADRYHRIEIGDRVVYLPIAAARRAGLAD